MNMNKTMLLSALKLMSKEELRLVEYNLNALFTFNGVHTYYPDEALGVTLQAIELVQFCDHRKALDKLFLAVRMAQTNSDYPFKVGDIVTDDHSTKKWEFRAIRADVVVVGVPVDPDECPFDESRGHWQHWSLVRPTTLV